MLKGLRNQVVIECFNKEKRIWFAIIDENAEIDVADLTNTSKKSECEKFYIINGTKKIDYKWHFLWLFCHFCKNWRERNYGKSYDFGEKYWRL